MSAENAVGLFAIGALVVIAAGWYLLRVARIFGQWPFEDEAEDLDSEETHYLSVQDQRHGDDGNSGHG